MDCPRAVLLNIEAPAITAQAAILQACGPDLALDAFFDGLRYHGPALRCCEIERTQSVDDVAWRIIAEHLRESGIDVAIEIVLDEDNPHGGVLSKAPETVLGDSEGLFCHLRSPGSLYGVQGVSSIAGRFLKQTHLFSLEGLTGALDHYQGKGEALPNRRREYGCWPSCSDSSIESQVGAMSQPRASLRGRGQHLDCE